MRTPLKLLDFAEGTLLGFDKPSGWTSFDLVKKVRNLVKVKKVGHAGTLDPLATGLLLICTGKMTKQINRFQQMPKTYTGEMELGKVSASHDLETQVQHFADCSGISEADLQRTAAEFTGEIAQVPPIFSAVKIQGKRAYKAARGGKTPTLEARNIVVHSFELTAIALPFVRFRVVCSKGTYIRALVRDFGNFLGKGAYMSELRRTAIGDFDVKNAWEIREFTTQMHEINHQNK